MSIFEIFEYFTSLIVAVFFCFKCVEMCKITTPFGETFGNVILPRIFQSELEIS